MPAGRPVELGYYDAQILKLLATYSSGASSRELGVYMDKPTRRVAGRLEALRDSGRIISFRNPVDTHELLWALPQAHLTPSPTLHRNVQKKGARTR